jgi:hypothetical protein
MRLSPHEIAWLFLNVQVPGVREMTRDEVLTATAVALAESGGDTDVLGQSPITSKYYGNWDHGLTQISGWFGGTLLQTHRFRDPHDSVRMFKIFWKNAGYTFNPWNVTDNPASVDKWRPAAEVGLRYPFEPVNPYTTAWRR